MKSKIYVHIGCGLCAPTSWENYDASPTLRIQKLPLVGPIFRRLSPVKFPKNVRYGNIIKGIPMIKKNTVSAIYSSHMLEHLSLKDLRITIKQVYDLLEPDGVFRMVLPDLEQAARAYVGALDKGDPEGSLNFMNETLLGLKQRKTGLMALLRGAFGNSGHLWMWDQYSLMAELKRTGFNKVRLAKFNDSSIDIFKDVEEEGRFRNAFALEGIK